ncbi:MAG TPA: hypothetical protein VM870_05930, partial [Pyrinomonadaceae bacterium]|nr:hypothetical protein [Pyrinomonadaceae bacterium]
TIVNQSLKYLDSLAGESADDAALQGELASAYEQVGNLQGDPRKANLNDFDGAIASYQKAQAIRQRRLQNDRADLENRRLLARSFSDLSRIRYHMHDFPGALKDAHVAFDLYRDLLADRPAARPIQLALAETQIDLANNYYFNNNFAETYQYLQTAQSALEPLRTGESEDREVSRLLGRIHTLRGVTFSWDSRQAEAEAEMSQGLAIYELLMRDRPNDAVLRQELLRAYWEAASVYEIVDNPRSFRFLDQARQLSAEAVALDALDMQAQHNLGKTYSRMGELAYYLGDPEIISYYEKGLDILTRLEKNEPRNLTFKADLARCYNGRALVDLEGGRLGQALAGHLRAAELFTTAIRAGGENNTLRRHLAVTHQYLGIARTRLAAAEKDPLRRAAHRQSAREDYQRGLDILLQLKAQNALPSFDFKIIGELETALRENEEEDKKN